MNYLSVFCGYRIKSLTTRAEEDFQCYKTPDTFIYEVESLADPY